MHQLWYSLIKRLLYISVLYYYLPRPNVMHHIRNNINIYNLIRHARIRSCHSFSALSIDLLFFIGGFEIDLTSCRLRWVSTGLEWE